MDEAKDAVDGVDGGDGSCILQLRGWFPGAAEAGEKVLRRLFTAGSIFWSANGARI